MKTVCCPEIKLLGKVVMRVDTLLYVRDNITNLVYPIDQSWCTEVPE